MVYLNSSLFENFLLNKPCFSVCLVEVQHIPVCLFHILHNLLCLPVCPRWKTRLTMAKQLQNPIPTPMALSLALFLVALLLPAGRAAETPQFTTVHAESDFEVRLYRDTVWMSAPTPDIPSFHVATKLGFHR